MAASGMPTTEAPAAADAEGERRIVTVLFADAVGFTTLSERLDEEQVYELMKGCTQRMRTAVERFGGNITQFRGDGVMAIFGAPIAQEDSARRAVAAGLEMQSELIRYRDSVHAGVPVQCSFRIGLNTGPVVVGQISGTIGNDYTALGDTVNVASRIEGIARPGSVTISDRTYRVVRDYFECESLGDKPIKGKRGPIAVYEVRHERDVQSRLEAAEAHGLTELVGRDEELKMLERYLGQAAEGQGQVVFVSGEAGIGKSRLLLEFERAQAGLPMRWLRGNCISFGQKFAYLPIVEIVKRNFDIEEMDGPTEVTRKVDEGISRWEPEARATAPYLKFLLQAGVGPDIEEMPPQERRAGIFDGLRAMVLQESRNHPLVIAIEDLHWVDEQSEEALIALIDTVPQSMVLLTINYRPGYAPRLGERSYYNRIALGHLSPEISSRMAERLPAARGLPSAVKRLLLEKAEGNPFYIEEVAKSLIESGEVEREGDTYRLTKPIEEIRIPDTIQDVILARIDRLEQNARQAMQLASVIGREFTVRLLRRVSDMKSELDAPLAELKTLELIYEKDYFPELSYMFKHALTHDVAYSTMLTDRRRALHRLVALAIEELYCERLAEQYETLAHHYFEGQAWNKALEFQLKAADKASRRFANRDAEAYLSRALEVLAHSPTNSTKQTVLIHKRRGRLRTLINDWDGAIEDFRAVYVACAETRGRKQEALALAELALAEIWGHRFADAEKSLREVERLAKETSDLGAELAWMNVQNFLDLVRGRLEEAGRRIEAAEELRHRVGTSRSNELLGGWCEVLCAAFQDRYEGADATAKEVIGTAQASAVDSPLSYNVRWLRLLNLGRQGNYSATLGELETLGSFCQRIGNRAVQSRVWNSIGWLHGELCDYERSIQLNEEGLVLARELGDPEIMMNAEINLADALWEQGDRDVAIEKLEALLAILDSQHEWMRWRYTQHLLNSLARMLGREGKLDRALELIHRSLELSERTGSRRNTIKNRRVLGQVLLGRGEVEEGKQVLRSSIKLSEEIRNLPQLWRSLTALGEAEQVSGQAAQAREVYGQAQGVLDSVKKGLMDPHLRHSLEKSAFAEQIRLGTAGQREGFPEILV